MDEKKRKLALDLRKDPSRSIAEICERLRISRATVYRCTSPALREEVEKTEPWRIQAPF